MTIHAAAGNCVGHAISSSMIRKEAQLLSHLCSVRRGGDPYLLPKVPHNVSVPAPRLCDANAYVHLQNVYEGDVSLSEAYALGG